MNIDCHGHYPTAPKALEDWRNCQIAGLKISLLKDQPLKSIAFDTCVFHQLDIDLMIKVSSVANILLASEMIGAVRGIVPETGSYYNDTKRYIEATQNLSAADRRKPYEGNARRVVPRLNHILEARGV